MRRREVSVLLSLLLSCATDQGISRIPEPPEVEILAPASADVFRQGEGPITVLARVSDSADPPTALALTWIIGEADERPTTADDQGQVTLELDPDLLPPGPHLVTLQALDSDDQLGWDSVDFLVWGPLGAPTVEIESPADGSRFLPDETIAFQGRASDQTTPAEDLAFAWSSDLDGGLPGAVTAGGESVLVTAELSEGSHLVTLTVTDTDGEVGTDSVTVEIGKEPEEPVDEGEQAEPGDLVLSELMVNPSVVEDTHGEWFELYNSASYDIQIQGYTLRDEDYDTWVIDVSMEIPARSYYLVCADLSPATNGGVTGCDAWFYRPDLPPPGMAFGNNGDEVILVRPDGVEIDRLVYDADWVETAAAVGVDPAHLDHEGNDDLDNWCPQRTVVTSGGEPGTPGFENDPC